MTERMQVIKTLMTLSLFLGGVAGCAGQSPTVQAAVPPTTQPAPAVQSGWETHAASADQGQCGYAIDHPSDMDATGQGEYSWTLSHTQSEPSGPATNFVYISVIPDNFQSSEPGAIYNYDPAEAETLLNLQVGASGSLREDPNLAPAFTYTRLPDSTLGNQAAQTYENTQPWEFPSGTKEIRYYLKGNGCTYLIGGYLATVGSDQPGSIDEELFDQIMASFRQN
jgi:hypothetical protein